jgi:anti-sigma B factor antagonist
VIFTLRHSGRIAIIELQGQLTLSPAVNRLSKRIEAQLAVKPAAGLVLNLAAVPLIDSAGLGELMKIHTFATKRGMRVALARVNSRVAEVFKVTRLDGIFAVYEDEASALQGVAQAEIADQP